MLLKVGMVKEVWAGCISVGNMRKAPEWWCYRQRQELLILTARRSYKETGEEKESEFVMTVKEGINRKGNGSKRNVCVGRAVFELLFCKSMQGTCKSSQLQRGQNSSADENTLSVKWSL